MPPMQRSAFSNLLAPGLRKWIFESYKEYPEEYTGFVNIDSSKRQYEDDAVFSGIGAVPEKTEGNAFTYKDAVQNSTKRYTHKSYGLGYRITHEMYEDDLYNVMKKMTKALARSFRNLVEVQAAGILNNATTAGDTAGADGKALLATDHPLIEAGGTLANKPATDVDISYTAVQNGIINFHQLTDEQNMPMLLRPEKAIVHPNDQFKAMEIFGQEAKPNTADRDSNTVRKSGLSQFEISHYLTDTDRWFLVAPKGQHDAWFIWRERVSYDMFDDPETKDVKVAGYCRFSRGHTDWRGWYGSVGV